MKATYHDFLNENPTCATAGATTAAQSVFELLSHDDNIIAMVDASEQGQPALTPCIQQIENYLVDTADPGFNVNQNVTRQTIGCMAKTILNPFGYRVVKQKNLPKGTGQYFASASCYSLLAPEEATMKVVKRIEDI